MARKTSRKTSTKPVSAAKVATKRLRDVATLTLSGEQAPTQDGVCQPTPERLMQAGLSLAQQLGTRKLQIIGLPRATSPQGADGVIRLTDAPLDRLHARSRLDEANPDRNRILFEAGERLRAHHFQAGLSGIASASNFNGTGGGGGVRTPITESQERHRRELRKATFEMDGGDWTVVVAVVCEEQTLEAVGRDLGFQHASAAAGVALDRLRRGLGALAVMWGSLPPTRAARAPQPVALVA